MKLFVKGRKGVLKTIRAKIKPEDKTIWFHCASLGEYEQGLPIMEAVKAKYPDYKLIISFFSPSGFEIKKDNPLAYLTVYLPLDTLKNAKHFIKAVHPTLAIFIKYEFWPNYLFQLKKNKIPTLLVSGLFRENQVFFKPYGGFMRKVLTSFTHFFVQDRASQQLLEKIGFKNITVSGDTRFDRVASQLAINNTLNFIEDFKQDKLCIVCGSTWPEDIAVLSGYINNAPKEVKFVIVPHEIEAKKIEKTATSFHKKTVLFSEKEGKNLSDYSVFIIDTIGILTKIYSYADIAYVGGAMGTTGLHNILEPAVFGAPVVTGNSFEKFPEAEKLQEKGGLFSVSNTLECSEILEKLVTQTAFRNKAGENAKNFIISNTGATKKIMDYVTKYL